MNYKQVLIFILIIGIVFTGFSSINAQQVEMSDNTVFRAEYLLFLEVQLNNISIGDEYLPSYHPDGLVFLPIGKLTSILQLPFELDLEQGTIKGFIWEDDKIFKLNLNEAVAQINGDTISINENQVAVDNEDIYLDIDFITKWFPFDITVNPYSSVLRINSNRSLPIEEQMAREYRWEKLLQKQSFEKEIIYPQEDNPYTIFSGPFVSHRLNFSYRENETTMVEHNTSLSGDFLYLTGHLNISGNSEDPFSEINAKLGRRSPEANLLGPLNAHEIWFGNVEQPIVENISDWKTTQGFYISSYPYTNPSQFYAHTFTGELPENWEVELYENGYLIDFQRSNEEGRYVFEDIPVKYGLNKFTLIFYDKYGPKYEETKTFQIDASLVTPGQSHYRLDYGKTTEGNLQGIFKYSRGLREDLSLNTNIVNNIDVDNGVKNYASVGLQGDLNGIFWRGNYLKEFEGGQGGEIGFYTTIAETNLAMDYAYFNDYESEQVPANLKSKTSLVIRRSFKLPLITNLSTRTELTRKEFGNDSAITELYNRLSTYYRGYFYKNTLDFNIMNNTVDGSGKLWVYKYLGDYRIRGELGYDPLNFRATNIAGELYGRIDEFHNFNLRISRDLENNYNSYAASLNRNMDYYQIGLNASYTEIDKDWKIGVNMATNYGFNDQENNLVMGTNPQYGAVLVNTFLDLGDREIPIEGVGYRINNRTFPERTNKDGTALISNLRSDLNTSIAINKETLTDPFLIVDKEGISFVPRPGQTFQIDLPVVMTSEIGGYVYLDRDNNKVGLGEIKVQVFDVNGKMIKDTFTAFDGYYYLTELKPGSYKLKVSTDSLDRFELKQKEEVNVDLSPEGGYYGGINIIVER